jgi:hypothetical protein
MTWDKPNTPLKWVMLLAPPSMCVLATIFGGIIDPKDGDWTGWALVGLLAATVSSLGMSGWLARKNPSFGAKFGCFLACFALYMVINGAVSFAGCAVGFQFLPGLRFM